MYSIQYYLVLLSLINIMLVINPVIALWPGTQQPCCLFPRSWIWLSILCSLILKGLHDISVSPGKRAGGRGLQITPRPLVYTSVCLISQVLLNVCNSQQMHVDKLCCSLYYCLPTHLCRFCDPFLLYSFVNELIFASWSLFNSICSISVH